MNAWRSIVLTDTHVKWDNPNHDAIMSFGQGILAVLPMKNGIIRVFASGANVTGREGTPLPEDF